MSIINSVLLFDIENLQ